MPDPYRLLRQTYEDHPYQVAVPQTVSFRQEPARLFPYGAAVPFYLRDRRLPTAPLDILDVGCGAGVTTLLLAEANPGARLVAIDLSTKSVQCTVERLHSQGYTVEGHVLTLEELPRLNRQFDYINAHEVLYLLPDPGLGLQNMAQALKPGGILRTNLHSVHGRAPMYRAQALAQCLGWMESAPTRTTYGAIREWMESLRDDLPFKQAVWRPERVQDPDYFNNNFLLAGDRGVTVPQLFDWLEAAGLHFLSMVDRRGWRLADLFQEPWPEWVKRLLRDARAKVQLHLHDLLMGNHRLLDFWASLLPPREVAGDRQARLNPILRIEPLRAALHQSLTHYEPLALHPFLPQTTAATEPVGWVAQQCLRHLWDESLPVSELVQRVRAGGPELSAAKVEQALVQLEAQLAIFLTVPVAPYT